VYESFSFALLLQLVNYSETIDSLWITIKLIDTKIGCSVFSLSASVTSV